ncbi:unnamed protein product [Linum tenue]|uniref:Uncharacterized protein n=1 Tax=Linum tenue TaxID=586396 RepID=A0AAV0PN07_9ROSI|nr:unnamed protein product [Linum tenue]
MLIYKPARHGSSSAASSSHSGTPRRKLGDLTATKESKDELRMLACLHGPGNVPSLITLVESIRSTKISQLKLFVMHLVELTERSSSIIMVQRARKNGFPFFNRRRGGRWHDRLSGAFQAYSQLGRVKVRPTTAISALATMHEDICHVAETKRVAVIILPFHKQYWGDESVENVGHGWRGVNQRVLKHAPCSVGLLVDRGLGQASRPNPSQRVCIVFFGGPDDREALELGGRMAEHPAVKVTVVRFVEREEADGGSKAVTLRPSPSKSPEQNYSFSTAVMNRQKEEVKISQPSIFSRDRSNGLEQELDEAALGELRSKWEEAVEYKEKVASSNVTEGVVAMGRSGDYDLMVVGKGRFPSAMVAEIADRQAEHAELGPIGDVLASDRNGVVSSVLVIQQHDVAHAEEVPVVKVVDSGGGGGGSSSAAAAGEMGGSVV